MLGDSVYTCMQNNQNESQRESRNCGPLDTLARAERLFLSWSDSVNEFTPTIRISFYPSNVAEESIAAKIRYLICKFI